MGESLIIILMVNRIEGITSIFELIYLYTFVGKPIVDYLRSFSFPVFIPLTTVYRM